MAHIYVYSPSGAVRDRVVFRRGVRRLQQLGHEVEIDPAALDRWQRFAGDDATRLAAIARAAGSNADVALISRGGYGITRLLPQLPWRAVAEAAQRGTAFVGFSDFTALQLGLLAQAPELQPVTWAGPALCEGFGAADSAEAGSDPEPDETMLACFDDLAAGTSAGTGWRLRAGDLPEREKWPLQLAHDALLWGGNLAMVTSLIGTPWWPHIEGGVLFLEDIGEHPYRIERMLLQLLHTGVLARQQAILLGSFTGYELGKNDRGFNIRQVVSGLRHQLHVPVLTGLPFGHVKRKVMLPVGARVDLLLDGRDALLLWHHAH